jgi:glycosyltransferase involved in cell wall biosynthesis
MNKMKVAIVCDWLTGIGGAERVLLELHHIFPDAPIYTSQYSPKKINWFKDADVRTTWLQKLPVRLKKFLPVLRAWTFSRLDLTEYDLIVSSNTGAESKGIKKLRPGALHICYMHAPTHYYWSRYDNYMKHPGFGPLDPIARLGLRLLVKPMRRWDYTAAQRPDYIITNSTHSQAEIKKYYGRDAAVIHPPVALDRFKELPDTPRRGFVTAGRQTPYKRIDLAVAACTELELPLTVIGDGPEHDKLVKMAGPTISFVTKASDQEIANYFASANGFIFPGLDDFGIVAVEALAAGTPLIAYKDGGALDYVVEGENGVFFHDQTVESLANVLKIFNASSFDPNYIKLSAQRFGTEDFITAVTHFITSKSA